MFLKSSPFFPYKQKVTPKQKQNSLQLLSDLIAFPGCISVCGRNVAGNFVTSFVAREVRSEAEHVDTVGSGVL